MKPGDVETLQPIQVITPGLTGFLQLKQTGRNPGDLGGIVQPAIELRDWMFQGRELDELGLLGFSPQTASVTATGFVQFTLPSVATVPAGQLWYVTQFTAFATLAVAADTGTYALCYFKQPGGNPVQVGPVYTDVATARATRRIALRCDRTFWLHSGDILGLIVFDIASAGQTFFANVRATALAL